MMHDLPVDSYVRVWRETERIKHLGATTFRPVLKVIERSVVVSKFFLAVGAVSSPWGNDLAGKLPALVLPLHVR